jgi:hypothetical protein
MLGAIIKIAACLFVDESPLVARKSYADKRTAAWPPLRSARISSGRYLVSQLKNEKRAGRERYTPISGGRQFFSKKKRQARRACLWRS